MRLLGIRELLPTFREVLATQPNIIEEYDGHHVSGGPLPENLLRTVQQGPHFFTQKLRNISAGQAAMQRLISAVHIYDRCRDVLQQFSLQNGFSAHVEIAMLREMHKLLADSVDLPADIEFDVAKMSDR